MYPAGHRVHLDCCDSAEYRPARQSRHVRTPSMSPKRPALQHKEEARAGGGFGSLGLPARKYWSGDRAEHSPARVAATRTPQRLRKPSRTAPALRASLHRGETSGVAGLALCAAEPAVSITPPPARAHRALGCTCGVLTARLLVVAPGRALLRPARARSQQHCRERPPATIHDVLMNSTAGSHRGSDKLKAPDQSTRQLLSYSLPPAGRPYCCGRFRSGLVRPRRSQRTQGPA